MLRSKHLQLDVIHLHRLAVASRLGSASGAIKAAEAVRVSLRGRSNSACAAAGWFSSSSSSPSSSREDSTLSGITGCLSLASLVSVATRISFRASSPCLSASARLMEMAAIVVAARNGRRRSEVKSAAARQNGQKGAALAKFFRRVRACQRWLVHRPGRALPLRWPPNSPALDPCAHAPAPRRRDGNPQPRHCRSR